MCSSINIYLDLGLYLLLGMKLNEAEDNRESASENEHADMRAVAGI
jgi:hypothetical protein